MKEVQDGTLPQRSTVLQKKKCDRMNKSPEYNEREKIK